MREIIIDTETTGLSPGDGHRIVELAALEMIDKRLTGRCWHSYFDPGMVMPADAERIHGLTMCFLNGKPKFEDMAAGFADFVTSGNLVVTGFTDFVTSGNLVIHNAKFDMSFINAELSNCGLPEIRVEVVDTLALARRKHPRGPNSLHALCTRYGVETLRLHGAMQDALALGAIYPQLLDA